MWNLSCKDSKKLFQGEVLWCWDQDLNASVESSTPVSHYQLSAFSTSRQIPGNTTRADDRMKLLYILEAEEGLSS